MSEPEMRGDCGCAGTKHRPTCHVECQRAIALLEAEVERLREEVDTVKADMWMIEQALRGGT